MAVDFTVLLILISIFSLYIKELNSCCIKRSGFNHQVSALLSACAELIVTSKNICLWMCKHIYKHMCKGIKTMGCVVIIPEVIASALNVLLSQSVALEASSVAGWFKVKDLHSSWFNVETLTNDPNFFCSRLQNVTRRHGQLLKCYCELKLLSWQQ